MSILITLGKFGFDIFYWKLPNIKEKKKTNFSIKNNIFSMKNDLFSFYFWNSEGVRALKIVVFENLYDA